MGKIQLKVPPWVANMLDLDLPTSDWRTVEKEVPEGATVGDLLADLAASHTDFRKAVFNPDAGKVSEQVNIVLNDSLLSLSDIVRVKLNDGDSVMLLPVYSGG